MKEQPMIQKQYENGERNFRKGNFSHLNIRGGSLANIDLYGADLSCASLIDVDLRGVNFTRCNLKGAHFKGCNLAGAVLDGADLTGGNLNHGILTKAHIKNANLYQVHLSNADLSGAYLVGSNLTGASLNNSDLSYANFKKSNLSHSFLTGSNLTETIFHEAILHFASLIGVKTKKTSFKDAEYNSKTLFDLGFKPEQFGMRKGLDITVAQVVNSLNYLSKVGSHYLGNLISVKYLENGRPDCEWISKFEISSKGLINFKGKLTDTINFFELKWYQQWVKEYIKQCSIVFRNFDSLIDREKLLDYQNHIIKSIHSINSIAY